MMHTEGPMVKGAVDEAAWIVAAGRHAIRLQFGGTGYQQTTFDAFFRAFCERLIAEWSEHQPSVQFLACAGTQECILVPLSEHEEVVDLALNAIPDIVPSVVSEMGATRCCFVAPGDVPDHAEVLTVGGVDIDGHRALGWIELIRDGNGHERLGRWTPFPEDGELSANLATSWIMGVFDPSRPPAKRGGPLAGAVQHIARVLVDVVTRRMSH